MNEDDNNSGAEGSEVGYGKPPKNTQFKKGVSGNPTGRPKGAKNTATIFREVGRRRIKITSNGKTRTVTMLEATLMQLINQAAGGNLRAIRETLEADVRYAESEQAPETVADFHERDRDVIQNLHRRMQALNKGENPEENN